MIAEALAGKRIAITGSTGFVGTALVERLLRQVPDCELVLLVRARTPDVRRAAGQARDPPQRRFDRLRESLGGPGFDEMTDRARAHDRRRCRHRRPRPRRGRSGHLRGVRHRHPLRGHRRLRLAARQRGRGQPAGPDPHRHAPATSSAWHRTSSPCRRVTSPATGEAEPRRNRSAAGPFDIGLSWKEEVAAARRLRSDAEAESRRPEMLTALPLGGPDRARRGGSARARRQDRAASRAVGHGPPGRGRSVASGQRRLAGRLRVHEGPRRAGAGGEQGRRPGVDRAAVDHRVRAVRAAARAGSAASAWPSPSSSPSPAGC